MYKIQLYVMMNIVKPPRVPSTMIVNVEIYVSW
uniref:Uncharacterized protein n=1 Tax=viral metagenome TaxID=1070528 RepID=A0A6C0HU81_9ZZZZ